ncbi:cytochrome P450 18a1 [Manduca sexta]|uniref:Cytochrome P450 n=1 Tax=Manduca sexta TaxID=7130 RepID=A0A922CLB5_MANSE|nr:cytochrome P450 18a1 [Manduca sexta]KAG6450063.1 hypothetical protein O3G_MSEX006384 [Manduca sexta]KAG6450064.1 hypothetical protein O3G_MSEX006384 [Manduca sexta]KAG6450065.1 hypothetical protein O3G_MSEX006384 [Manduca sexta]KAG6450066.1 hypothetical protein O3G_MSEX006384 [Manduca sexta]
MWIGTRILTYAYAYIRANTDSSKLPSMTTIYLLAITYGIWVIFKQIGYYRRLPPGPWGIPYFGYLLFLKRMSPQAWYRKMAEQYGDIFSVKMGNNLVVCIGSAKLLKDLFYRSDSTGRPHTPLNELLGGHGIVLSEGDLWKKQRQFLHEKFRALGIKLWPNQRFEKFIIMEIQEFLTKLEASSGKPVDPTDLLGRHIHNVICQLMMSFRFEENDDKFAKFNEIVSRGMKLFGSVHIGEHIREYLLLPGKKAVLNEIKRNLQDVSKFHGDRLSERIQQRNGHSGFREPSDLLDHYLDHVEGSKKTDGVDDLFPDVDPNKQIIQVMNDLFSAGMETSLSTLSWSVVMMIREPKVAGKVRDELRQVLPPGHLVTLEHRAKLPYTEAVLFETLRRVSVVPLGTTHVNTRPLKIGEYVIPAGTHIIPLLQKMGMDPETYPEPEKFKPERFLKDGQLRVPDSFMQFGVGQRMCLGTQLARMELFLFFANLMNSFDFTLPYGVDEPELQGVMGSMHAPAPFTVNFRKLES